MNIRRNSRTQGRAGAKASRGALNGSSDSLAALGRASFANDQDWTNNVYSYDGVYPHKTPSSMNHSFDSSPKDPILGGNVNIVGSPKQKVEDQHRKGLITESERRQELTEISLKNRFDTKETE